MQWEFEIKVGLFEWVGIMTNMENMITMVCQHGPISSQQYAAADGWRMTREGDPNRVKQHQNLVWGERGAELDVA